MDTQMTEYRRQMHERKLSDDARARIAAGVEEKLNARSGAVSHAGAWRVIGTVAAVLVAVVAVGAWLLIGLGLRNGRIQEEDPAVVDTDVSDKSPAGADVQPDESTPSGTEGNAPSKTDKTDPPAPQDDKTGTSDNTPAPDKTPDKTPAVTPHGNTGTPVERAGAAPDEASYDRQFDLTYKDGDVTPHETVQEFVDAYAAGVPCMLNYNVGGAVVTYRIKSDGSAVKTTQGDSGEIFPNDTHGFSKLMLDREAGEYKLFFYGSTAGANSNYGKPDDWNVDLGKADYLVYGGENDSRVYDSAKSEPVYIKDGKLYGADSLLYFFRQYSRRKYAAMTVNGVKYSYRNGLTRRGEGAAVVLGIAVDGGMPVLTEGAPNGGGDPQIILKPDANDPEARRLCFCPNSYGYSLYRGKDLESQSRPAIERQTALLEAALDSLDLSDVFPAEAATVEIEYFVDFGRFKLCTYAGSDTVTVYSGVQTDGFSFKDKKLLQTLETLCGELIA